MNKALKWIGIGLGGLVVIVAIAVVALSLVGGAQFTKTWEIAAEAVPIPTDDASMARGEHLVQALCTVCHGEDLTGEPLVEDPVIATIYGANITGLGDTRSDLELVLGIRHAIAPDGRQLVFMPAELYVHLSAEDLGSVIGYLKSVPRSGEDVPEPRVTMLGKAMLALGLFGDIFPASYVDHSAAFPTMPEVGANVGYGEYLARFCMVCHGADLAGAQPPDPESPYAPALDGARLSAEGFG